MVMFRRQPARRNNNNSRRPRRNRPLARTQNGVTQNGAGVSRMDNVRQVRKLQVFDALPFENASSDYAFGLVNINLEPKSSPLKELLDQYSSLYEQYRIRRVRIRAQVGKGFTNDARIKTLVGCRVDVDRQPSAVSIVNVQSINCAENTVVKTFTERGNVLLATYRPKNRMINTFLAPILPSNLQFYPIADRTDHRWKGATVTAMIPDTSIQPGQMSLTLITEVEVEFRGRVTDSLIFNNLSTINQHDPPATYDDSGDLASLRLNFLTGAYHPGPGFENVNVANIGTSEVTTADMLGNEYRINSTNIWYKIMDYQNAPTDFYGANLRDE